MALKLCNRRRAYDKETLFREVVRFGETRTSAASGLAAVVLPYYP